MGRSQGHFGVYLNLDILMLSESLLFFFKYKFKKWNESMGMQYITLRRKFKMNLYVVYAVKQQTQPTALFRQQTWEL